MLLSGTDRYRNQFLIGLQDLIQFLQQEDEVFFILRLTVSLRWILPVDVDT